MLVRKISLIVFLHLSCEMTFVTGRELNKVLVKEIHFAISPRDSNFNVTTNIGRPAGGAPDRNAPNATSANTVSSTKARTNPETDTHGDTLTLAEGTDGTDNLSNIKSSPDKKLKQSLDQKEEMKVTKINQLNENGSISESGKKMPKDDIMNKKTNNNKLPVPNLKIIGGTFSQPDSWPWIVSIQYLGADYYWHHFCAGSLISDQWIVSAAHCVTSLENHTIRVVLGDYQLSHFSHREQVFDPEKILTHAYFEEDNNHYDIAMIKLHNSAEFTSYVQSVPMTTFKLDSGSDYICYIAGWGKTVGSEDNQYMSDYVQQCRMSIISKSDCRQIYQNNDITDRQICVFSDQASACLGDSGGPLVCFVDYTWTLAGVASYIGSSTCKPLYPNVFTRISSFHDFVMSVTAMY